ncbi:MAG: Dihydropteroate synthase, partial [uncultured Acidimicrobiales bacterium]
GARPGRAGHRRPARPVRRAALGRHVAGVGGDRRLRHRRRGRQRHQRLRRPGLPAGGRRRRRRRRRHPHPPGPSDRRSPARLRRRGGRRRHLPHRTGRAGPGRRHPERAHRPRRRPRPRQDVAAVAHPAAALLGARRARPPAAPVRLEQDVPRRAARPPDRGPAGRQPRRPRHRHRRGLPHPAGPRRPGGPSHRRRPGRRARASCGGAGM